MVFRDTDYTYPMVYPNFCYQKSISLKISVVTLDGLYGCRFNKALNLCCPLQAIRILAYIQDEHQDMPTPKK